MTEPIRLMINGRAFTVPPGTVLAAAIAAAGVTQFRRSVSGQPRFPVCGMGCRVTINGQAQGRSCQTLCESGMEVRTDV